MVSSRAMGLFSLSGMAPEIVLSANVLTVGAGGLERRPIDRRANQRAATRPSSPKGNSRANTGEISKPKTNAAPAAHSNCSHCFCCPRIDLAQRIDSDRPNLRRSRSLRFKSRSPPAQSHRPRSSGYYPDINGARRAHIRGTAVWENLRQIAVVAWE